MALALVDDTFYRFVSETSPCQRLHALKDYFIAAIAEGHTAGHCTASPHGAAIWTLPGSSDNQKTAAAVRRECIAAALGDVGMERWDAVCTSMAREVDRLRPDLSATAWYLSILGITPREQRKGLASQLLEPVLRQADAAKAECWLETFGVETLPFYARFGFFPLREEPVMEPVTGASYWICLRAPVVMAPRS